MATLENEELTPEDIEATRTPEQLEEDFKSEPEVTTNTTPETANGATPEDTLPEKYQGKSMAEVVKMHQEAEKRIGKQGGEVGELRAIVDDFIQKQTPTVTTQTTPEDQEESPDFFEDPQAAVSNAIDNHPAVVAAKTATENLGRQSAAQAINEKHPDAGQIVADPAFVAFIKESPIRRELFARADAQMDVAAADELLTQFKSRTGVAQAAAEADKASRQGQLKQANTGSTTGSSAQQGKRIYRRADIIKLMREKPDRYEALAPEIELAYQEGRVK